MKTSLPRPASCRSRSPRCLPRARRSKPPAEALRPVRAVELRYDRVSDGNRYVGTVQARHEVDQAFRVGGKITERRVDVGQTVREGDVLAVLDDVDYRLTEEATRQELVAATAQARQAESDKRRLEALKKDGSVSVADDEHARSSAEKAQAAAEAAAKKLELARNRLEVHGAARIAQRRRHAGALRDRPGRGRRPAGRLDRRPGRTGNRRRRTRGSPRNVQEGSVQGVAGERPR